jgi:hypothetical protein
MRQREHELHHHQLVAMQLLHLEVNLVRKLYANMMEEVKMMTKDFARRSHEARRAIDGVLNQCNTPFGEIKKGGRGRR